MDLSYPRVFLIAEPKVDTENMLLYLEQVGGESWYRRIFKDGLDSIPHSEGLIEFMARLCYRSWEPGLNKNVTKIREDRGDYLLNILRSGHGSVLSHAHFSFVFNDVSRVFTAEMNRHAVGTDISEQSLRYVRLDKIRLRVPKVLSPIRNDFIETIEFLEKKQQQWAEIMKLDDPKKDFAYKKEVTSALRRAAPMGLSTEEGWTGSVRAIRHIIEMRSDSHAEEEIRIVADQMGEIMQEKCPLLFGDYTVQKEQGVGNWSTHFRKV